MCNDWLQASLYIIYITKSKKWKKKGREAKNHFGKDQRNVGVLFKVYFDLSIIVYALYGISKELYNKEEKKGWNIFTIILIILFACIFFCDPTFEIWNISNNRDMIRLLVVIMVPPSPYALTRLLYVITIMNLKHN